MGMDLPKAPEGYFWDSYLIRAPKGAARVTQLRKKVFWVFSKPVGDPKAEVVVFDDTFPNTVAWAEDLLREVKGK